MGPLPLLVGAEVLETSTWNLKDSCYASLAIRPIYLSTFSYTRDAMHDGLRDMLHSEEFPLLVPLRVLLQCHDLLASGLSWEDFLFLSFADYRPA